eukprot:scaffold443950_cov13-Prasinocladus_malaysianus.AAC.1
MHVHGSGGRVEQPKVLPRNGGAHRAGESLNHCLGDNTIPEGMRAPNVSRLRAVRRRPPPTGAHANRHEVVPASARHSVEGQAPQ